MPIHVRSLAPVLLLLGCGSGQPEPERPPSSIQPSGVYVQPAPATQAPPPGPSERDAPEISRSAGVDGGIVVLWPRIVLPRSGPSKPDVETIALARRVQKRLADLARRAHPNRAVDVRPEPERVCPRSGCKSVSVGALLAKAGTGCAAFALVSAPGPSPTRIVPWAGEVRLSSETVPFREHPERVVGVKDYKPCATLIDDPPGRDADVVAAMSAVR